jgi:predicted ATP-dependent endonuclease of OLD family
VRLISFTVKNFRRFVEPTSIKLHGDLIALIGPNEAGKSSILQGLALLHSDEEFARTDEHRRSGTTPELSWCLQLEDDDKAALADIPEAASVHRVVITKGEDGTRRWAFFPHEPVRERESRTATIDVIVRFLRSPGIEEVPRDEEDDFVGKLQALVDDLALDANDLGPATAQALAAAGAQIETLDLGFTRADVETEDDDETVIAKRSLLDLRDQLAHDLTTQARREAGANPAVRARKLLAERLPGMVAYTQEDRDLHGSYDLEVVADDPPPALKHLRALAGLDLVALRQEIRDGLRADVATRRDRANRTLRRAFDQSWNQQKVALQIDLDGTTLFIHAISLDATDAGLSDLGERSDGMRWFASLLAFVHGWVGRPILLVDEIETHLHYDAQADLVNVLGRQEFTAKVIYTTHSFGCLPPDIGTGIRLVEPVDQTTSRLANGFWRNGVGFSPLLTSLGAAAVSFTPSRHAVVVEGPSDAILLPTLLRQASAKDHALGFQIVPGVAEVATARAQGLTAEAGHVVFLVDGDEGGLANRKKLIQGQIDADSIVVLGATELPPAEPLETEDLLNADVYVAAVNDELSCWNTSTLPLVTASDLGSTLRTKALEAWCTKHGVPCPDKIAVAERVIEASTETDEPVYAAARQDVLQQLRSELVSRLGIV